MNHYLTPAGKAAIDERRAEHLAANAERRKARALNNLPPVSLAAQDFLDSRSAKHDDRRFSGASITGWGDL